MVGAHASSHELRLAARRRDFSGITTGHAPGYVQANLAILPAQEAAGFVAFCHANARACPILAVGEPGDWRLPSLGYDIDVRSDLPKYWIYRAGEPAESIVDIFELWQDDHVAIAIGCWFSMEDALARANVRMRHIELGIQGPLFRTTRETIVVGRFGGPLVVSMRPFAARDVATVTEITSRFSRVHGGPLHIGDPLALGIADISRPDFGELLLPSPGEVAMYWGCGLTALRRSSDRAFPILLPTPPVRCW